MRFTKESRTMMDLIIPYMDKFIKQKRSRLEKDKLDAMIKIMYFDIRRSYQYTTHLYEEKKVKTRILTNSEYNNVFDYDLFQPSAYFTDTMRETIKKHTKYILKVQLSIFSKQVNVYIGLDNIDDLKNMDDKINKIIRALYVLHKLGGHECSYPLDILLFDIKKQKTLPKNGMAILGPSNINSAVTTNCNADGNVILIYREEEWFKIFIHELFHSLNLDYSYLDTSILDNKLKSLFNIKCNINSYEAYTECWATIINCLFCAYELMDKKDTCDDFILYFELCINFERVYSVFQLIKILNYMNLTYKNLNQPTTNVSKILFKQKTNVFSYYILKTIYLIHYNKFMEWCYFQNTSIFLKFKPENSGLDKLFDFIKKYHNTRCMNDYIQELNKFYRHLQMKDVNDNCTKTDTFILNTTRMTICELK